MDSGLLEYAVLSGAVWFGPRSHALPPIRWGPGHPILNYTRHTWIFRRDARRSHPIAALRLVAIGPGSPPRRALLSGTISTPRLPKYSRATGIFHIWMGISSIRCPCRRRSLIPRPIRD